MEELLMAITGHYTLSRGDEENSEEFCADCGRMIGPMEDCICWWPNDYRKSEAFFCKSCRSLSLGD